MNRRFWLAGDLLFLAMFLLAVVVQFNDPDPFRWAAMYGLAALACLSSALGKSRRWFPLAVGAVALVWMVTLVPKVVGKVRFGDMFGAWEMKNEGIEQSREMYGLLLIAGWMAAIAWRRRHVADGHAERRG